MLKVIFQPRTPLRNKIRDTYTDLYERFKKSNPSDKGYTRQKLRKNIADVLSVSRISIDEHSLRVPSYAPWANNGWKVFTYKHWYFAAKIKQTRSGEKFIEIQDCLYEGFYTNDNLSEPYPQNESARRHSYVITESMIRQAIKEAIRKILA